MRKSKEWSREDILIATDNITSLSQMQEINKKLDKIIEILKVIVKVPESNYF